MSEATRARYHRDGYIIHDAAVSAGVARALAVQVEEAIDAMAAELDVPRRSYLSAVCRWSTPNPLVEALVASVAPRLRAAAGELLGANVRPERAAIFRKSADAAQETHGHQDAGYWIRPESSRYDATTWLTLDDVDEGSGALRVVPGSHRGGVAPG